MLMLPGSYLHTQGAHKELLAAQASYLQSKQHLGEATEEGKKACATCTSDQSSAYAMHDCVAFENLLPASKGMSAHNNRGPCYAAVTKSGSAVTPSTFTSGG